MTSDFVEKVFDDEEKTKNVGMAVNTKADVNNTKIETARYVVGRKLYESPTRIKLPIEDTLISGKEKSSRKLRGITRPEFIEIDGDGAGIFKTFRWEQERSAYLIDRFLNLEVVPPTVTRTLNGETGSMQQFIPDAKIGEELDAEFLLPKYEKGLMKVWILDVMIGNWDRHSGNWLLAKNKIWAIDNGCADMTETTINLQHYYFSGVPGLSNFFDKQLPNDLTDNIKRFFHQKENQDLLEDLLAELLGEEKAAVTIKRILRVCQMIIENDGLIPKPKDDIDYLIKV